MGGKSRLLNTTGSIVKVKRGWVWKVKGTSTGQVQSRRLRDECASWELHIRGLFVSRSAKSIQRWERSLSASPWQKDDKVRTIVARPQGTSFESAAQQNFNGYIPDIDINGNYVKHRDLSCKKGRKHRKFRQTFNRHVRQPGHVVQSKTCTEIEC